jgi:nicotinate phosphoribosyltransferase
MRTVDPEVYDLPYDKIRDGYYSAVYFNRGKHILTSDFSPDGDVNVTMQVFQKDKSVVCGLDESIAILKCCADDWDALTVYALRDGDYVTPWETVMTIEGPLKGFMQLESVYLGILRDQTTVATNMRSLVDVANGRPVIYLADRFNNFANQEGQGYAAHVGGAFAVCTEAGASRFRGEPIGTMAHALIAAFEGDVVEASRAFRFYYPDVNLVSLVDFNNDCVTDALGCAYEFGKDLWGVRLDTSEKMVDVSIGNPHPYMIHFKHGQDIGDRNGVNPTLVRNVRDVLDGNGFKHVKIIVSGGFNAEKIQKFEMLQVPVDMYGVGSSVLNGCSDFTADIVEPIAKKGREFRPNDRMELVR